MALPNSLLTIDIGSERTKIAHVVKKGQKSIVQEAIIIQTPEESIKDGAILKKDELVAIIKEALTTHKIKEKKAVVTISSSKIITREVELPYLKPNKLKKIIAVNAEDYFPVNLADYTMDYSVTDVFESETGKVAKVIVYAVLTSLVQAYVDLADACQLKIQSVDYSGNGIVSYVQHEDLEGTNLFMEIGATSTMVTITTNNVVKFSRNVMFGTKYINDAIKNHYEVSYTEAIKISKERQLLSSDKEENTYLTSEVTYGVKQILEGVSRLVDYYASRNKKSVEKVYILGGGAEIFGIEEYVEKFFKLKTEKLTKLSSVQYKDAKVDKNLPLYFSAAIGASLSKLNLLPQNIKGREIEATKRRLPILVGILVLVFVGYLYFLKFEEYSNLKKQEMQIQAEIESMVTINAIIEEHTALKQKADFRKTLDALSTSKSNAILDMIEYFEISMPKDSFIVGLADSEVSLTLDVRTKDEATLAQFLKYLKAQKTTTTEGMDQLLFSNVFISQVTREGDLDTGITNVSVTIECTYTETEVQ